MLQFTRWKVLAILAVVLAGAVFALPNVLPKPWQDTLRHYTGLSPMVRGLDLEGGSSFLVELDSKELRDTLIARQLADTRQILRSARIGYKALGRLDNGVTVEIIDAAQIDKAQELLRQTLQPADAAVGQIFELARSGQQLAATFAEKAIAAHISQAVDQSVEVLQRRLNGLGITEASVQRQGLERILIQVPGKDHADAVSRMIGLTGLLSFRVVCDQQPVATADMPPDSCAVFALRNAGDQKIWVTTESSGIVEGNDINDANVSVDAVSNEPVVTFRLNQKGAQDFARLTSANVGRSVAIVIDELVFSAPRINEPITGGWGQISGQFTAEEANGLALVLRSGALPAHITMISMSTAPGADAPAKPQGS